METPEFITHVTDQHDAWLRDTIERIGWAVTYVHGGDEHPPFGYTIGLAEHGRPELIMFGTNQDTTAYALNEMGRRITVEGTPDTGAPVGFRATVHRVWLVPVPDSSGRLLWANKRYRDPGGPPIPALQAVYDDRYGHFPWDAGYTLPPGLQPVLGDVASRPPGGRGPVSRAAQRRTVRPRPPRQRPGPAWPRRR